MHTDAQQQVHSSSPDHGNGALRWMHMAAVLQADVGSHYDAVPVQGELAPAAPLCLPMKRYMCSFAYVHSDGVAGRTKSQCLSWFEPKPCTSAALGYDMRLDSEASD